jgi:hypothetical protein
MKLSEFEAKLGTVSDDRLRQMLATSRARGPEVAVELILAEGRRRGLDDFEDAASHAPSAMATSAYPKEGAGAFGSDAPESPLDASAPALAPEWLAEETKSGMPMALKAFLLLAVVGCILALAWKFTR